MQLIAIGNNIINLDTVSVLDIDPTPQANTFVVHVHCDSNQPVIDISVPIQTFQSLMNLVPQHLRLPGVD